MGRVVAGLWTLVLVFGLILPIAHEAKAESGQIAAGVAGGLLGGMLLGSALASRPAPPPPVYYYAPPPPERVYVGEPICRLVRQRFWDGYDWHYRNMEVCD
jgi:hypothetical protein